MYAMMPIVLILTMQTAYCGIVTNRQYKNENTKTSVPTGYVLQAYKKGNLEFRRCLTKSIIYIKMKLYLVSKTGLWFLQLVQASGN